MSDAGGLPWTAAREDYEREADALLAALRSGSEDARWAFKREPPVAAGGTPLDWAVHGRRDRVAEFLRGRSADPGPGRPRTTR